MTYAEWEYLATWRFPAEYDRSETSSDPIANAPQGVVEGCRAVGLDLRCRRHGRDLDIASLWWTVSLLESGACHIGLEQVLRPRRRARGVSAAPEFSGVGFSGLHTGYTAAMNAVLIAEHVQDDLAGYEFIQWPVEGSRLLMPEVRDGQALWFDPGSGLVVSRIGELCSPSLPVR
ncbi:hypothetical protein [Rhodococcus marinonascens]|uniref:hypothetical protein n=1 Tax=Rhodococcus marinonascens TaxID=38311 RepID=UPI001473C6E9|nr:hypothetical protein [Rhodococcus marinonascens]